MSSLPLPTIRLFLLALLASLIVASPSFADPLCVYDSKNDPQTNMPFSAPLKRGINLSRWWEQDQDRPLKDDEISNLHDLKFDFVRLPIDPKWLLAKDSDQKKAKLLQLRCDIISLLNGGLNVVLDMHPDDKWQARLNAAPDTVVPQVEKFWQEMHPLIADLPAWRLYIELFNEPMIDTKSWWRMQGNIMQELRPIYETNTFVASPGPYNGWWQLIEQEPYADNNVIYDFHFYEPMEFTHHGAEWLESNSDKKKTPEPIVYPVNDRFNWDMADPKIKEYVNQDWNGLHILSLIKDIKQWRLDHNARVVCFEFGVYRPFVDDASRNAWIHDTREALDNSGIPWAMWEYRGPFGLLKDDGSVDKGTAQALDLGKVKN